MKKANITYADGAEAFLLDFFKGSKRERTDQEVSELLSSNHDWSLQYHLSPQRHFLLSWYEFKPNSSILEIGAGCGAVTGLFLSKASRVVANELEESRAAVIKARFPNSKNLTVNSQSIRDFSSKEKFDYVIVIGVLEYAGVFFNSSSDSSITPHQEFLLKANSLLKPSGKLLLAIENRLGLKYFAGHPEDHTGVLYDSLNNYSSQSKMKTFSKSELTNILLSSGFSDTDFYYPYPDYKLPYSVFSEEGLSENLSLSVSEFTNSPAHNHPYQPMMNESALAISLKHEGILGTFANSFLVEARL